MLILSRKFGERIMIGNDITITILGLRGSQARLGIDAPREIVVNRQEVHQRICAENQLAAKQKIRKLPQTQEEG